MNELPANEDITDEFDRQGLFEGWSEIGRNASRLPVIKFAAKTDLGRVRENNEDKFDFYEPEDPGVQATKGFLYAVADGMGGHSAGQVACELALTTVIREYYADPSSDIHNSLRKAASVANALVWETSQMIRERNGMGTTLTVAVIREDTLTLAQIGDSRAYLLRDGVLTQLTEDHSWVAEQVRMGAMTADDAGLSPFRNLLTRSIGTAPKVDADISNFSLVESDVILLCTDGLSGHLTGDDLQSYMSEYCLSAAVMRMIDEANERGGQDNITAALIAVRQFVPIEKTPDNGTSTSSPSILNCDADNE